jgi:hypothetical protein
MVLLSEGRACKAWNLSNKEMFFPETGNTKKKILFTEVLEGLVAHDTKQRANVFEVTD